VGCAAIRRREGSFAEQREGFDHRQGNRRGGKPVAAMGTMGAVDPNSRARGGVSESFY
jgi:hypothetical protein